MSAFTWGGTGQVDVVKIWKTGDAFWRVGDSVSDKAIPGPSGIVEKVIDRRRVGSESNGTLCQFTYRISY